MDFYPHFQVESYVQQQYQDCKDKYRFREKVLKYHLQAYMHFITQGPANAAFISYKMHVIEHKKGIAL